MRLPGLSGLWGMFGVLLLLAEAIVRLFPPAIKPFVEGTLTLPQGALYLLTVLFFAYAEGYRGFQKSFSPRAAARAVWLDREGTPLWLRALAPLFCMALVRATRRRLIANWILVIGIVVLIVLVRLLPHPWRAMVDGGVVIGLSWGGLSLLVCYARQLRGTAREVALGLPDEAPRG